LRRENIEMFRRPYLILLSLLLLGLFLSGCPKRIPERIPEKPPFENPIDKLLKVFSSVDSLQASTLTRIETVRNG